MIEVRNFSFGVGRRQILRDISFKIDQGEFVCLLGPNGAGKTTLIKCLMRIVPSRQGGIRVASRPLETYRQSELARRLAYVPQADGRVTPFTVYELVMMGRYPHLSPFSSVRQEDHRAVNAALELAAAQQFAERSVDSLSGGERQKVFLAAALAQQAEVLLLDEPAAFLDLRHQVEINVLLAQLNREQGQTIVCATHDINSALATAQRIIALRAGAVFYDGPAAELASADLLHQLYDHDFSITEHPQTGRPVVLAHGEQVGT